ncbi:bifunctional riboflavin kinase/FAD synthetase [Candidatus Pelagibacter sp.]|nr:bifunctional riboflavin kinase/FAD synthetase [Candidatus Pelagibacter sp.]
MKIFNGFNIPRKYFNSIILVGNFDGVHLGHQKLFKKAREYKKKFKSKIGVITFNPMPKMFFNQNLKHFKLMNTTQKIDQLRKQKVDFLINQKFSKKFSKIKAELFIQNYLNKKIKAKVLFVSNNFRFGNKREGDINLLKSNEIKYNYKLIIPQPLKKNNKIISSTKIRKLLSNGNLKLANKYLTRKWEIEGKVQKGRKVGGKIGFATCNIDIGNYIIAKPGVYAVKARLNSNKKKINGIANLGFRPTFNQNKILLEVNLFNFNRNIYNKKLIVEFIKFIRREKKFKSIKQLTNQIKKDIRVAKTSLK